MGESVTILSMWSGLPVPGLRPSSSCGSEVSAVLAPAEMKLSLSLVCSSFNSTMAAASRLVFPGKLEVNDGEGVEKSYSSKYFGRAEVKLDKLSLSDKICIPINEIKVLAISNSMQHRFDLFQLRSARSSFQFQ